ncbi:MAG: glycosyltransferase family 39 protein [Deltaproteobacteria bacterium]|nr:glycosyltransferase family 39 protein [Deltaproteobacteria bacterium]
MSRAARLAGLLGVWGRRLLALACLGQLALLAYVLWRRAGYPFDLEWMEGGMLVHSWRIMKGQPLYGPPSVDFVSYLYTPLYPAVVAALGKLVGLHYVLGRLVSIASLGVVMVLGYRAARREGAPVAVALVPAGLLAAAFPFCGAWYDVVRNDSLFLALVTGGLYLVAYHHGDLARVALAGVIMGLALLTKQTASAFIVCASLGLLLFRWRSLPLFLLTAGATLGLIGGLLQRSSGGWFWTYIYRLHQNHDFYAKRAFLDTPLILLKHEPITLGLLVALFVLLIVRRHLTRTTFFWALVAGAGLAISCVGFGTQWAFANAFIPGVAFPALALATLAGRAYAAPQAEGTGRALFAAAGALLLTAQLAVRVYDPRPFLPTAQSRAAGERLIARLRQAPGPVFVPDHPFYAVLAGKEAHFHRMGLWDVRRAGYGFPRGLVESIQGQKWALVVMDSRTQWHQWPGLQQRYRTVTVADERDMPHVFSGAGAATEKVRPLLYPKFFMEPISTAAPATAAPPPASPATRPAGPRTYDDSP